MDKESLKILIILFNEIKNNIEIQNLNILDELRNENHNASAKKQIIDDILRNIALDEVKCKVLYNIISSNSKVETPIPNLEDEKDGESK